MVRDSEINKMPRHTQQWKGKRSVSAPHADTAPSYSLQSSVALREIFPLGLQRFLSLALTESLLPRSPSLPAPRLLFSRGKDNGSQGGS